MNDNTMAQAGDASDIKNSLELALLTAGQPLPLKVMRGIVGEAADAVTVRRALEELKDDWASRAMQLIESAGGYQFVSRPEYAAVLLRLNRRRPPRLSRSLLEVLAIIAYRQPATRGDVEAIRGVAVSSSQLAFLEEQGWVEEVGKRETPGRPMLYATTKTFLDDLGVASLDDLPPLESLEEEATHYRQEEENTNDETADAADAANASTDNKENTPDDRTGNEADDISATQTNEETNNDILD